jgi:cobalt-zinc-cadmium efflux system protein
MSDGQGRAFERHDPHAHEHHSHDDDHHGGGHVHAPAQFGAAFAIGVALNLGFVIIEVVYGIFGHSVALFADAGHISATCSACWRLGRRAF